MGSYGLLWRTTFWLLVQGLQSMWIGGRAKNRSCVSFGSNALTEGREHLRGLILEEGQNGTVQCPHNQCCFGIWNLIQGQLQAQLKGEDQLWNQDSSPPPRGGLTQKCAGCGIVAGGREAQMASGPGCLENKSFLILLLFVGCWISEKEATCDSPICESQSSEDALTFSCMCRADLCNDNIRHDGKRHADSLSSSTGTIWIISACPVLLFLGFLVFLVVVRLCKGPVLPMRPQETGELTKVTTGLERYSERKLPKQELPDLQFHKVLHEGQCSKVWQGTFGQHPVAIKTFPHSCYREFASEWAVQNLPLMSHENVVRLVATGYGGPDKEQGNLLVLTLYPLGSLRLFLTHHVCSWDDAIRLGSSLAKGLAFLHGEQWKEGLHKPGVAHRDLSSQNVLVQEDMTCVISDFGLAMTLPLCHERWREGPVEGVVRKAGAPRYTAPEILDESLNLQDLGSALRQADVYSMALVLWETLMRCFTLFPENSTPEFQLAYEAELGSTPTYSELRRLAVEQRGRPAIPPAWRRMGQVSACLQELLEDCWDPEPEARLQAECAQQRLQRLGAADVVKECR